MKRGLLKEIANTPTAIVCGWRLYGPDLPRLRELAGAPVEIDLLTGVCSVSGAVLDPPLGIAGELSRWTRERFDRDGIPAGTIARATTTVRAQPQGEALAIDCGTVVETTRGTYSSHDATRWGRNDYAR